ncbi:hypothetical protein GPECTOR_9g711 [Gonium pectorale]|uniref:Uncharacterized protein n=1 Tax=Gonium pectorale TaxID=33097 RepID=A0A150GS16_GONPE|nr:hypothetical protein GPECTOR_9g711 [Gonium pectorale]|eukprot:KXZ52665.1 hypothetical protein GPECTOR_9g711 [Gonium pectorale]
MERRALLLVLVGVALALGNGARLNRPDSVSSASAGKRNDELTPEAAADQILSVPGFGNALPSNHFGGYITVNEEHGRRLFYYFAESERDPANDPVIAALHLP